MSKEFAVEYNSETGETTTRPFTAEEIAENAALQATLETRTALEAKKQEVLTKLGLTADEVAALLA
jgi:hypothetical protein